MLHVICHACLTPSWSISDRGQQSYVIMVIVCSNPGLVGDETMIIYDDSLGDLYCCGNLKRNVSNTTGNVSYNCLCDFREIGVYTSR